MSKNKSQSTVTTTSTSLYISLICLFPVMFLISYLIFYMIDTMLLKLDVSFVDSFLNHKRDGAITGICMWALCFYYVAFGLKINRPQQSNVIATARWRTLKEQKKYFGEAPIDTTQHLDVGGAPVQIKLYYMKQIHFTITVLVLPDLVNLERLFVSWSCLQAWQVKV